MPPEKTLQNGPTAPPQKKQKLFASSDPHHPLPPWLLSCPVMLCSRARSRPTAPDDRIAGSGGRGMQGGGVAGGSVLRNLTTPTCRVGKKADVSCHALLWHVMACSALLLRPIRGADARWTRGIGGQAGGEALDAATRPPLRAAQAWRSPLHQLQCNEETVRGARRRDAGAFPGEAGRCRARPKRPYRAEQPLAKQPSTSARPRRGLPESGKSPCPTRCPTWPPTTGSGGLPTSHVRRRNRGTELVPFGRARQKVREVCQGSTEVEAAAISQRHLRQRDRNTRTGGHPQRPLGPDMAMS